jgi:ribonuclease P/MRP protein subunit POP5
VGLETWPDATFDRRAFQRAVWASTRDLIGAVGSARVDPTVLRFDLAGGTGSAVVRVRREEVTRGRGCLACVTAVGDHPVGLRVRGVAGTIRACEEKYIGQRSEETAERNVVFGDATRPAVVRNDRLDVGEDGAFTGAADLDFQPE